ncbi:MAG TPA: hypothetical protein VF547_00890 [Allosphingosinicella sp.]
MEAEANAEIAFSLNGLIATLLRIRYEFKRLARFRVSLKERCLVADINLETQEHDLDDDFVVLDADDFVEVAGGTGGHTQVGSAFKA